MSRKCRVLLSTTAVLFATVRTSLSEEPAEAVEAETIVVTATRIETPQRDAPTKVTVITEEEIRATGAQTIDEAMRDASEVGIVGDSLYQGVKPQAGLRGVPDQSRTLVLVDGVPLNAAWLGRIEWWMLPVESVERIELAHGPMSAVYGSAAMGGVVNVTTKTPTEASETVITGGYGGLDSWSTGVSQGGRHGNFAYYFAGRFFQTDGYIPEKDPQPYDVERDREDWSSLLKLVWEPDESSSLAFGYIHGDEEACRGREYFNRDDRTDFAYLKYSRSTAAASFKGTVFLNDQLWKRDFDQGPAFDSLVMVEDIDHRYAGGMFESTFPGLWWEGNSLTVGVDYRHGSISLDDDHQIVAREAEARGRQGLLSFFVHDEVKSIDGRIVATLGLRADHCRSYDGFAHDDGQVVPPVPSFTYDYEDRTWTEVSPKASLVYHPAEASTLRASYGHAFHAPELQQLYTVLARPNRTINGNPDLEPETLDSCELGFNRRFDNGLLVDLGLHYGKARDFIGRRLTTPGPPRDIYDYDNISEVDIGGAEFTLTHRPSRDWLLATTYTFNMAVVDEDDADPGIEGNDLPLSPRHRATLRATYGDPAKLAVSAALHHVGSMYADDQNTEELEGYWTLDLRLTKQIGEKVAASLACRNLFDERYDVPNVAGEELESPGAMISMTLSAKW